MKDSGDAFEAHAGVDGRLRQGIEIAAGVSVELHENEVPDFDVAAAVAGEFAIGVTLIRGGRAHVVEDFAAWTAGAGVAHRPEVFFQSGNADDAILGRADFFPAICGFAIHGQFIAGDFRSTEYGEVELVERDGEPIFAGDKLPRVGDGLFLEIIAEGKISEHFEKREVTVREADVFQIVVLAARAHAFLAGSGRLVVALLEAEENVLELVHPGVGEEQRGIIRRDERRAAHDAMAALLEKSQKCLADFVAGQCSLS